MYTVEARRYAATNPDAWFYGRPITLEDHQRSRWIVEPILRLLDCCQESDGGVALVVDRADARHRPAPIRRPHRAAVQSQLAGGDEMFNYYLEDLASFPEARAPAAQIWRSTGLGPADVDVALLYENFSPIVFLQLEAFDFCGPGEARDFIADGHILGGGLCRSTPTGACSGRRISTG